MFLVVTVLQQIYLVRCCCLLLLWVRLSGHQLLDLLTELFHSSSCLNVSSMTWIFEYEYLLKTFVWWSMHHRAVWWSFVSLLFYLSHLSSSRLENVSRTKELPVLECVSWWDNYNTDQWQLLYHVKSGRTWSPSSTT